MQTHLPIGYKMVEGKFYIDQEKADTVKRIYNEYVNGKSMIALAKELKEKGVPNANNKLAGHIAQWEISLIMLST